MTMNAIGVFFLLDVYIKLRILSSLSIEDYIKRICISKYNYCKKNLHENN